MFVGGRGRVAGVRAAAALTDSQTQPRPSVRTAAARAPGSASPALHGLLPKYQLLPKGLCPPQAWGKQGKGLWGGGGRQKRGVRVSPLLLQHMSAQGRGRCPEIAFGFFGGCFKSLCVGWSLSREQSAKGVVAPKGTGSSLVLLPCEPRHSPKRRTVAVCKVRLRDWPAHLEHGDAVGTGPLQASPSSKNMTLGWKMVRFEGQGSKHVPHL